MRYFTLLSLSFLFSIGAFAQDEQGFTCGANEQPAFLEKLANEPGFQQRVLQAEAELEQFTAEFDAGAARNEYVIPIVFHIIHNNGPENITDEQVIDAVRVLNEDFNRMNPNWQSVRPEFLDLVADVGISFELARRDPAGNCTNGITRTESTLTYEGDQDMKGLIQWPRNRYLNVWVSASANGAAGYTYYPGSVNNWAQGDGIVVLHSYTGSIGTSEPYRSHVLTHEVGHWLNLRHCWGNSNEPGEPENCGSDDLVGDTPNTIGWTICNLNGSTCGSGLDNVENYMEYSYCYKMFTNGQKDRMLAALNSPVAQRNQLWIQSTHLATGLQDEPVLCEVRFSHGRTEICQGESIQFNDMSFHDVVERTWQFPGGEPATSTDISPIVTYTEPGYHAVTLTVTDGTDTLTETVEALVHVHADPGMAPPLSQGFENSDQLPLEGWRAVDRDNNGTFQITDIASYSGQNSVMIPNGFGARDSFDELRSPSLDMENATGLAISFRYAYAQRNAGNDDRLRVHLSIDCGVNWSIRKQLRGTSNLNTAGIVTGNFIPQGEADWELCVIDVPNEVFHVSDLMMRFEFESDGGNNLFIDDINIHGTPVGISDHAGTGAFPITVRPNPAAGDAEISFTTTTDDRARISLKDPLGRELIVMYDGRLIAGEHRFSLPLSTLANGVYLVEVLRSGQRSTARVIKDH